MAKDTSVRHDVEGWLSSNSTDLIAVYATNGRKHEHLTDDDLTAAWVAAFRRIAHNLNDLNARSEQESLRCELILRNRKPPYGLVRDEFDKFIAEAIGAIEQLEEVDPARFEEINPEIEVELQSFKTTRDRTKS